jgi:molybdate transport system substrate-binding protein
MGGRDSFAPPEDERQTPMQFTFTKVAAVATVAVLALGACGKGREAAKPDPELEGPVELPDDPTAQFANIYATPSLQGAVEAVAKRFEPLRGGTVVPSFGPPDTLIGEIRKGGVPGVFVADGLDYVDRLEEIELTIPKTRVLLMCTSLVVVVAKGGELKVKKLDDLTNVEFARLAVADPDRTRAGRHALDALEILGIAEMLKPRFVAAADDEAVLSIVAHGDAEAGIVYATEAAACPDVAVALRVPAALHQRIVYAMVLAKGANRRTRRLWDFLKSDTAWKDFAKAGFSKPAQ